MNIFLSEKFLERKLQLRREEGTLRTLAVSSDQLYDFSSNDYLGLAQNAELSEEVLKACKSSGINNGASGSRLISGNSGIAEDLERRMAIFFRAEATLLFNSGYTANIGILSTLPQKGDTILYDELAHASIKDGIRLSHAKRFSFRHNDLESLKRYLNKAEGQVFVVVESVYSMDGDTAPLRSISEVCNACGAALIVDEAHSTGIYGEGSGLVCELGLQNAVFARVHTFGKAIGSHGACIAGSEKLKEFLINFSRPFIYTTALPPHNLINLKYAFEFIENNQDLIQKLRSRIDFFRSLKEQYLGHLLPPDLQVSSDSPIQPIVLPGNEIVVRLARELRDEGFDVKAVLSPTVAKGKERLRICLHTYNTVEEIEALITAVSRHLS